MSRRETIHVSLGSTANAVTAHWLNLEGLAVTSGVCDPLVTHQIDAHANNGTVWVPRVLFVGQSHHMPSVHHAGQPKIVPNTATTTTTTMNDTTPSSALAAAWNGTVQEVAFDQFASSSLAGIGSDGGVAHFNNTYYSQQQQQQQRPDWVSSWHQTATELAYAPYSQYRVDESYYGRSAAEAVSMKEPTEEQRHVNWDDMGDEPDEEDQEEASRLRQQQQRRQQQQWQGERYQLEHQLSSVWNPTPPATTTTTEEESGSATAAVATETNTSRDDDLMQLSWGDYWMPPYPSPLSQCLYALPLSSSYNAPLLHVYNVQQQDPSRVMLDDVWEQVRHQLERVDACQGFRVVTEQSGLYTGMTQWLLQELQAECKAAGRWVFQVVDDDNDDPSHDEPTTTTRNDTAMAQARVRNHMQRGLALAGLTEAAHAVVPLQLPSSPSSNVFQSTATLAMALETALLPTKCSSQTQALMGWNSRSGYEEGGPPNTLSLSDFLSMVQPSSRLNVLELDTMTPTQQQHLSTALAEGTSVERDHRMRQRQNTPTCRSNPGGWMLDASTTTTTNSHDQSAGLLTSLAPGRYGENAAHDSNNNRALHHHFGLSTSLRRPHYSSPKGQQAQQGMTTTNQQYLTCVMEGMGIQYRPETSMGLVLDQSLSQLTTAGAQQYGAGSYWKYVMAGGRQRPDAEGTTSPIRKHVEEDVPVLSVLGNTTRVYPYLYRTAKHYKDAITSSKTKGYVQRAIHQGTLPELDDCEPALETCLQLRDAYEPPQGSGLVEDDDGHFVDY